MERRVDNLQVVLPPDDLGVDRDGADLAEVRLVDVLADDLDKCGVALKLHVVDGHLVHLVDDTLVVRSQHLRAVLPIGLVAIVLTRVVAGRDVHTSLGTQVTHGV
jgi:hypothetical protein